VGLDLPRESVSCLHGECGECVELAGDIVEFRATVLDGIAALSGRALLPLLNAFDQWEKSLFKFMYELVVRPVQLKLAREARGKLARERTLITDNPM